MFHKNNFFEKKLWTFKKTGIIISNTSTNNSTKSINSSTESINKLINNSKAGAYYFIFYISTCCGSPAGSPYRKGKERMDFIPACNSYGITISVRRSKGCPDRSFATDYSFRCFTTNLCSSYVGSCRYQNISGFICYIFLKRYVSYYDSFPHSGSDHSFYVSYFQAYFSFYFIKKQSKIVLYSIQSIFLSLFRKLFKKTFKKKFK